MRAARVCHPGHPELRAADRRFLIAASAKSKVLAGVVRVSQPPLFSRPVGGRGISRAGLPERYYVEAEAGLRHRWADLSVPQMWQLCEAVGLHPTTLFLGL